MRFLKMAIKSIKEIEARKAGIQEINEYQEFKNGAEKDIPPSNKSVEKTQLSELSKLNEWQLADKFEQLDSDYHLLKWRIAFLIKGKFKSSKLYGQFLQDLRDKHPSHPLCMIKTATLRRYYKAAEICDTLKIENLKSVGLSPTIIYELGELKNKEKLEEIYNRIKNDNPIVKSKNRSKDSILNSYQKNVRVQDVQLLIKQIDSIDGEVIKSTVSDDIIDGEVILDKFDSDNESLLELIDEQNTSNEIIDKVFDFINSFSISITEKKTVLAAVLARLQ